MSDINDKYTQLQNTANDMLASTRNQRDNALNTIVHLEAASMAKDRELKNALDRIADLENRLAEATLPPQLPLPATNGHDTRHDTNHSEQGASATSALN